MRFENATPSSTPAVGGLYTCQKGRTVSESRTSGQKPCERDTESSEKPTCHVLCKLAQICFRPYEYQQPVRYVPEVGTDLLQILPLCTGCP